jgi:hypothetical protein
MARIPQPDALYRKCLEHLRKDAPIGASSREQAAAAAGHSDASLHGLSLAPFLLETSRAVLSIQCVESARHDHEGQVPKEQRHLRFLSLPLRGGARLFVSAEERNQRVSEIFPSLQIFRHPGIPLRNCSVHVRDIELARPGQFGVFLRLFSIVLCWLRSGLHSSNPPYLAQLTFNSEMGHRDESDGAKAGLN